LQHEDHRRVYRWYHESQSQPISIRYLDINRAMKSTETRNDPLADNAAKFNLEKAGNQSDESNGSYV